MGVIAGVDRGRFGNVSHLLAIGSLMAVVACGSSDPASDDPLAHMETVPIGLVSSRECQAEMETLIDAPDSPDLLDGTLEACVTVDEWGHAASLFPAALGLTEGTPVLVSMLQNACADAAELPTCVDAVDQGLW